MAIGYNYVELKIKKGTIVNLDEQTDAYKSALDHGYAIYIYQNTKANKFYIGQTIHFNDRNRQHFDGNEEKFNQANFNRVIVLFSRYFNRSALDDVEKQLITYFVADISNSRKNSIYFDDDVINLTKGNETASYLEEEDVASKVVLPFWEDVLYPNGWVKATTINDLRASALVKYSPIKELTDQQSDLINEILINHSKSFVINGDAGTGKTVLLTHLVAQVINDNRYNIAVVVQPNWEKTAEEIFKIYAVNNSRLTIGTSTKLIKQGGHYDIIIVDESHKLSRRFGKQHPSFNSVYQIEGNEECQSHLEIMKRMGDQMVLMYDVLQSIRPANIERDQYQELTEGFERRYLTTQFRIRTPKGKDYTSDDYINGIKWLLYKDTQLLKYTNFNPAFNRDVFRDSSPDAYFGLVNEQPLHELFDWINEDKNFHPEHVNRVLAGLVEDWRQKDGKDSTVAHWHEGDLNLRWNATQDNWINSKDEDAEEQIGSVFAVQGIDLNKVGVLIGSDLQLDGNGQLFAEPDNFYNVNGKFSKDDYESEDVQKEFTLFVLNIYYVLLTRGIDGIRIGFWHNDTMKDYVKNTLID